MNSTLTRKQINAIIAHTPAELKGTFVKIEDRLGMFWKSGANWAYIAGWTAGGVLVVTAFGEVQ